jgi:hypothetical protein
MGDKVDKEFRQPSGRPGIPKITAGRSQVMLLFLLFIAYSRSAANGHYRRRSTKARSIEQQGAGNYQYNAALT